MKKLIPFIVVIVIVLGAAWYFTSPEVPKTQTASGTSTTTSNQKTDAGSTTVSSDGTGTQGDAVQAGAEGADDTEDKDGLGDADVKPATQIYKTAEDALKAVKDGANDYDDLILEQFTNLGENCSWCDSFYKQIKDLVLAPDTKKEQKSYFAEILAVSGKIENLQALVDAIKNSGDNANADVYAEALELTYGKDRDDIVNFLGGQLSTTNERLKESAIAAITNQGSPLAANLLYKQAIEAKDPDGFYSLGIGLGELVPDEKTVPLLQEMAAKRDQYSHLAVKSLLNGGMNGLKVVFDLLKNSSDPEFDRQMLKGAVEHVSFEDGMDDYLKKELANPKNPVVGEFAKQILDDFNGEAAQGDTPEAPFTPLNQDVNQ